MAKQKNPPTGPKYPQVRVKLTGTDGNAFALMGRCQIAARDATPPECRRAVPF